MSQITMFPDDLSSKRVSIGISGGINSAAALCYLGDMYPAEYKPRFVALAYVHLSEHSPDTLKFALSCIRYACDKFDNVRWSVFPSGSVLDYFERENLIPHPIISPCSEHLKIARINEFRARHACDFDVVGFIRTERQRIKRQMKYKTDGIYAIAHLSEDDCLQIVDQYIGWHPAIYDIVDERGKRVFKHNNCLPCKNMSGAMDDKTAVGDYLQVAEHYPEYYERARQLSERMQAYWGRAGEFDGACNFCEI